MHILLPYQFVAVNQHRDKIIHVFVNALSETVVNESTNVICIDFINRKVYDYAPLESYLNEVSTVRLISPERDDLGALYREITFFPDMQKIHLNRMLKGKIVADEGFLRYNPKDNRLVEQVRFKFEQERSLGYFDFLTILPGRSMKGKRGTVRKLEAMFGSVEEAARAVSEYLSNDDVSDYERFVYLANAGLRLQAASAILAALFPERFMRYNPNIMELQEMRHLRRLDNIPADRAFYWEMYRAYMSEVIFYTPLRMGLQQKEQYMSGKAVFLRLVEPLSSGAGSLLM